MMLKYTVLISNLCALTLNLSGGSNNIDSFIGNMMGNMNSKPYTTTTTTSAYATKTSTVAVNAKYAANVASSAAPAPTQAANVASPASYQPSSSSVQLIQNPFDIQQMACLVNYQRQLKGVKPLTISSGLIEMARQHSDDQAQMKNMTHTGSNGSTLINRFDTADYPSRYVAENVAWNQRSVAEVVQAWVNSPGHYANMINPSYTEFGAACVNWYWTFDFGSSAGQGNTVPNCSGY
ncbi:SCP-domain-containing protein [Conidiobolus coronatus NRRL 28638]|uniref:SCP-domain-containing protein n=1 Tax=Conidiobolus coronatus (strain ATCC 28846 / CBS 209.66 / NRRL 28638) TaxID=796925 RepID=A0A137P5H0_CONC2|nr:SCP-domain-containing protein [Conidiobolus coronatus NRRL 28638]|eukprot:KXN70258.1 SCP-domain-containing protein [Conidiobolus coronatus NRRL 28638]